jgi:hypothetical protein
MKKHYKILFISFILGAIMLNGVCTNDSGPKQNILTALPGASQLTWHLPSDNFVANQQSVDEYAWRLFIALNWRAGSYPGRPDTTQTPVFFGTPGDLSAAVWDTYKDIYDVFTDTIPDPWAASTNLLQNGGMFKTFNRISKTNPVLRQGNLLKASAKDATGQEKELLQASGNWLTDQDSNLIWYDVRINEDEFNYIFQHQLYNSTTQIAFAQQNGIWLPDGTNPQYGSSGSIEVKAGWRIIPPNEVTKLSPRYKMIKGLVPTKVVVNSDHTTTLSDYQPAMLGLVALHIIRKTPNFPQFTWATFEHVDLAPTEGQPVDPNKDYILFNKNCPNTCTDSTNKTCYANQNPNPKTASLKTPIQVVRCASTVPDDQAVAGVNQNFQSQIRLANPQSVFQYYQLVSTQWPKSPVKDPATPKPTLVPLTTGNITPDVMGNLAAETYALNLGCMSCHQFGFSQAKVGNTNIASDYSFIFGSAKKLNLTITPK